MKRTLIVGLFVIIFASGCATEKTSVYERRGKQQLDLEAKAIKKFLTKVVVGPSSVTTTQNNIEITLKYQSLDELDKYFDNKELFGDYAGVNPYSQETTVFYVKISNKSGDKIKIDPNLFTMLDDMNSQYSYLGPDLIMDLYLSKASVYATTKTTGETAPGIYGAPFTVASAFAKGPARKRMFLLKQVTLNGGYVYDGVVYDGYIAFSRPHEKAKIIKIILPDIKSNFAVDDTPGTSLDFEFNFDVSFK